MRWIRLWTDETFHGSTFKELNAEQRGVWFSLLVMAGMGQTPGLIELREGVPHPREVLAVLLNCPLDVLDGALERLVEVGKVRVLEDGRLEIANWRRYQTEYEKYHRPAVGEKSARSPTGTPPPIPPSEKKKEIEREKEKDPPRRSIQEGKTEDTFGGESHTLSANATEPQNPTGADQNRADPPPTPPPHPLARLVEGYRARFGSAFTDEVAARHFAKALADGVPEETLVAVMETQKAGGWKPAPWLVADAGRRAVDEQYNRPPQPRLGRETPPDPAYMERVKRDQDALATGCARFDALDGPEREKVRLEAMRIVEERQVPAAARDGAVLRWCGILCSAEDFKREMIEAGT